MRKKKRRSKSMLSIDVVGNEELIRYLTRLKGKLENDTYLITVTKPNTQIIIPAKNKIYSEQFTAESFSQEQVRKLVRFILDLLDLVQTEWDKDHKLIIHSYEKNGVARGIADFIFHVFPEQDINQLYYNTFELSPDFDSQAVKKTNDKLIALKDYFLAFGLDI